MSDLIFQNIDLIIPDSIAGDKGNFCFQSLDKMHHKTNIENVPLQQQKEPENITQNILTNENNNIELKMEVDNNSILKESEVSKKLQEMKNQKKFFKNRIESSTLSSEIIYRDEFYFKDPSALNHDKKQDPINFKQLLDLLTLSHEYLQPLSFSLGQTHFCFKKENNKYVTKFPSPKLIPDDVFCKTSDYLTKADVYHGLEIHNKKGIVCVDKNILIRFRGIVSDMISQLLKRIFGGPPVSLNVKIFDTHSSLKRNLDAWSYAPHYLNKSANKEMSDKERFNNVIAFALSGLIITCKQLKPFNPQIGETFEGEFSDGTKLYGEHIGHYPTISLLYMVGPNKNFVVNFKADLEAITESFGGVIYIVIKGDVNIEFPKLGKKFMYRIPKMKLENCRSEEERNCYLVESMEIFDLTNEKKAIISFGYNEKSVCDLIGGIFHNINHPHPNGDMDKKFNEKFTKFLVKYNNETNQKTKKDLASKFPVVEQYISGSFVKELLIDGKKYWNIDEDIIYNIKPLKNVLPSDTRYREDLIWLYYALYYSRNKYEYDELMHISQSWKVETELIQRKEREIRAEHKKKHHYNQYYKNK